MFDGKITWILNEFSQERNEMKIGRFLGVPVFLNWSFLLFLVLISYFSAESMPLILGAFLIVLLHEFGHVIAGIYFGLNVISVTLYPFGGIASMIVPKKPKQEMVIALAGPMVNVLLIPIIHFIIPYFDVSQILFKLNLMMLVFNLIPALPLDGGRVLRSTLCLFSDDYVSSTMTSCYVAKVISWTMIAAGFFFKRIDLFWVAYFVFVESDREINAIFEKKSKKLF